MKKKRGFVKFASENMNIFDVILYLFSSRAFAIRLRDGSLNIGYGYEILAVPVYLTSNKIFQAINIYTK
ncbi:hypothetical protein C6H68_05075 [Photorhabdus luminescens]|nr:hypothetical protein C6H68_05075 [Photorhabdus luminescens]